MKYETLEEGIERAKEEYPVWFDEEVFILGAKWMRERSYSDEIIHILDNVRYWETCPNKYKVIIEEWFEQFKKK